MMFPTRAGARESEDVLATKLRIPRTREGHLHRSRLVEALDRGIERDVVLVCSPAGFGKTTLLAEWAQRSRLPVAWLSLDPEDADPARFWRSVVMAIDRAIPGIAERVLHAHDGPGMASRQTTITSLVNALEAIPDQLAFVLDDYHVMESQAIHDDMAFLLRHLPPQLHVVIASRSEPALPLARLRADGRLNELRAADLRFTQEESGALLQEVWNLSIPSEAVAALEARTEGWAVGLQLAALSLRERDDPASFVEAFTGSHRFVLDYLSTEVLESQTARLRDFLLATSILDRLSAPLCDAVTQAQNSRDILEELDRANLFVVPLDDDRRWFRYHHLFRELLLVQLQRSEPDRIPDLYRRAATWSEAHDLIDDAVRYALKAGDPRWARRLVEAHLGQTLRRGESVTLRRWLSQIPNELVRSSPALCVALGLMELHLGHLDSVDRLIEHAERGFGDPEVLSRIEVPTDGGMVSDVPAALALLRSELASARGEVLPTSEHARSAIEQIGDAEPGPRLWGRWLQVLASWMDGQMEDAESGFARLLAEARSMPKPHPLTTSCHSLGWVQQARGELTRALRTYDEGLRYASEGGRFLPFHAGEAHIGIAQVLYARNELDEALDHVTTGIELVRHVVEFQLPAFGQIIRAWILQAMGDEDGAREAMDEACRLLPATGVVAMFSPAQTERAALMLAQGHVGEAARWAREQEFDHTDEVSYPRERDHLTFARLHLARSEPERALRLLDRLDTLAASQGRRGSLIEIRSLEALATHARGDDGGALSMLVDALALARPEGYVRVFVDAGPTMSDLLRSLLRERGEAMLNGTRDARDHVKEVLDAFVAIGDDRDGRAARATQLIDPLTARELEILQLVAEGLRNADIARQLVVTIETVKKHVTHILGKLGASTRTQAVTRAREFGLIR